MALLKSDVKGVSKSFLRDLDAHLKNFALTDRSRWLLDAAQEKILLSEIEEETDE